MLVHIENINDNPPTFEKSEYKLDVNEVRTSRIDYNGDANITHWSSILFDSVFIQQLTPVNSSIGVIKATDEDSGLLYYSMEPTVVGTWFIYFTLKENQTTETCWKSIFTEL